MLLRPTRDAGLRRRREARRAHQPVVRRADPALDDAVAVDPYAIVRQPERCPELGPGDRLGPGGADRDRGDDPPSVRARYVRERADRADRPGVRTETSGQRRPVDAHRPGLPGIRTRPLAGIAHAGQPRDRVGGGPSVPDVLDAVRVATVGRSVAGL